MCQERSSSSRSLLRNRVIAPIVAIFLAITVISVVVYGTESAVTNPIKIELDSKGGLIQNITVSCYQCVPYNTDKWEGNLIIGNAPIKITYGNGGTVALMFGLGYQTPRNGSSPCPEYSTNSTCVYTLPNDSLPFNIGFDIHKTSSGGVLKATVYLPDGSSYSFQTPSGELAKTLTINE